MFAQLKSLIAPRLCALLLIVCLMPTTLCAQELDAKVTVNAQKVEGTNTAVFEALQEALKEFINTRQWTNLQFRPNERISCSFSITIEKYDDATGDATASLMVQSSRPVYNSAYTTTVFSTNDPSFSFNYREFDQLEFRVEAIDKDLTALIAYYAYLIIGMDLDTMAPLGGTEVLETAKMIVTNAQSLLLSAKGWKAFDDEKNRFAIINDYLDNGMKEYREFQYKYYREGLDIMAENADRGRVAITEAFDLLKTARENKPMSRLPELFTEYKRDEIVNIYVGKATPKEKEDLFELLSRINASQNTYWRKIQK
ncbi:MAG: DUF4835 family protein [Bacteroidaceae bacterium]|nr:DUF4835 family protein [Bacteroidaceae bacterium]